ncbi:MAG: TonB-dependent receptor, partial [Bacteroidota bacterium]
LQGGYNQLQKYYGNYNLTANVSDRFLESDLGVMVSANVDNYDRSADKFTGNYRGIGDETGVFGVEVQSILLREERVKRGRTGASILLDYRIPGGKVTANSFYNRLQHNSLYRINRMDVDAARHYYDIQDRRGTTSIFTGAIGSTQDFGFLKYDISLARTASRSDNPEDYIWEFAQENNAFDPTPPPGTPSIDIPGYTTPDSTNTGLANIYISDTRRSENQSSVQLNLEVPFNVGDFLGGYIKAGVKFRWLDRTNDENQYGRNGLQYGSGTTLSQPISVLLRRLSEMYPDEFNFASDSALVRQYGVLPLSRFQNNYTRSNFLNNDYPLGYTVDESMMRKVTNALRGTDEWLRYAIQSRGRDYDGIERYQAAYIMSEINVGQYITVLPGIRWEKDYSRYHGQSYRQNVVSNIERDPLDLIELEAIRQHDFWLPMVHVRVKPASWLNIRLARTETLTRPDYIRYAPITSINNYSSYINAANSLLKPARATNYDAAFSVYHNYVGLFSVAGFYKSINDLILQTTIFGVVSDTLLPEGVNVQSKWWLSNIAPQVDTYTNNPSPAMYKGFELDWQTHFWYLPSFLQGLILNVNYTRIYSQIDKQLLKIVNGDLIPGTGPGTGRPARYTKVLVDSSRSARMPDQPAYILNVTLGYDIAGFSARLSYLFQTDKTTALSLNPTQDSFTGEYARWDLTLQQHIGWGVQVYSSFTNLNNRPDRNFRGSQLVAPTYTEYYGFAMDVGIRYRF